MTVSSASPTSAPTPTVDAIESFLQEILAGLAPEPKKTARGRPRILPALALWGGVLVCILRGTTSQLAVWRLLSHLGLWSYPRFAVSDQAVYTRLARGGTAPLEGLFGQVCSVLAARHPQPEGEQLASFAAGVYAIDQTQLDPVARSLPTLRSVTPGSPALLPGRLNSVFDIRRQLFARVTYDADALKSEVPAVEELTAGLPCGALLVMDLGYYGFARFDALTDAGYFWLSRLKPHASYQVLHTFYAKGDTLDAVIWLGAYQADRGKHAVRLVQYRVGKTLYRYITNMRDPRQFPLHEIAQVYARRWDIEMAFQLVKDHLQLQLLWSAKPVIILQQIWATLIIAQILQSLRLQIARAAGADVFEVSMPLLVEYLPTLLERNIDPITFFAEHGRAAGFIRPSRRTRIDAPIIAPAAIKSAPANLVLERTARYAERRRPRKRPVPPYGSEEN